jgi:hypothetical protein
MTGLIVRQGQTARSNPWALHTLWLRQLVHIAVVKRFLCFYSILVDTAVLNKMQEQMQERERAMARRTPTRLVDLASADLCATSRSGGRMLLLLSVIHMQ